ncbi:MAG: hypothetical protein E7642_05335 [Ruminococcaceae bacterium]|nr:hypothetical protein [Oscillospiraceae bacterium]
MKNNKKVMKKKTKRLIGEIAFIAIIVLAIAAIVISIILSEKALDPESPYAKEHAKLEGHGFLPQWSTNATHHWHDCKHKTCTEVIDKAEHTWNDGEYSIMPTPTHDGELKYECTVCKRTKTEVVTYDQIRWSGTFEDNAFENFHVKQIIRSPYTNSDGTVTELSEYSDYFFTKDAARRSDFSILDGSTQSGDTIDFKGDEAAAKKAIFSDLIKSLLSDLSKFDHDKETDKYSAKADTPIKVALDGNTPKDIVAKDLEITFQGKNVSLLSFTYNDGTNDISVSWTFAHYGETIIAK